jgi:DNA-binding Lrp family transcriptional regulator
LADEAIDGFDRKILAALQHNGRLTNNELAEQIGLSPSQCSRRRTRLEQTGLIAGYHARIDRERAGFALVSIISVTLATHTEGNADRFARLVQASPNILEAHALTGEMDYSIKVVTEDLHTLSDFISRTLLAHEAVQNVKTAIVLNTVKDTAALPLQSG